MQKNSIIALLFLVLVIAALGWFFGSRADFSNTKQPSLPQATYEERCFANEFEQAGSGYELIVLRFYDDGLIEGSFDYVTQDLHSLGDFRGGSLDVNQVISGEYRGEVEGQKFSEERTFELTEDGLLFLSGSEATQAMVTEYNYLVPSVACSRYLAADRG